MNKTLLILIFSLTFATGTYAQTPQGINFQGYITSPDGSRPTVAGASVNLKVLAPNGCVLREEGFSGVNISEGYINLVVGHGTVGGADPGLSFQDVFENNTTKSSLTCVNTDGTVNGGLSSYAPSIRDSRKLRMDLTIAGHRILVDFNMRSIPFAMNSESLNGKNETHFVNINNAKSLTQTNVESIFNRFTQLDSILNNFNAGGSTLTANIAGNAATATTATNVSGVVAIANGGTGSTTASDARIALGLGSLATVSPTGTADNTTYLRGDGTWATVTSGGGGTITSLTGDVTASGSGAIAASVVKIQGKDVASTAPGTTGQVLRWDQSTSKWTPSFTSMFDLRSTVTGLATFGSGSVGCTSAQTLTWTAATDNLSCTNILISASQVSGLPASATIDTTNADNITSGTLNAARMPAASGTADGIVNQIAQSFKGIKTFLSNVIIQGTLTVSGDVTSSGAGNFDHIKLANSSAACDAANEGSLRYNSTSKKMEFCNGSSWSGISAVAQANLSISTPSTSLVKSGPVTYDVTYGSATDAATISLAAGDVTFGGTATTGCVVTGVTGSGSIRTITIDSCTGTGTVNISIAAGTANSTSGDPALAAGPSMTFDVDNTGPLAPSGISLGSAPNNFTNSPTITYTAASDVGGSTVASHQVQIIKTSDSSVVKAWGTHTSGNDVSGLSLESNTQYSVLVRGVDAFGNLGTASAAVDWTTITDSCVGNPVPGTVCAGGAIFIGSLSPGAISGSGTDRYMTTPGGCGDIPAGQIGGGSGSTAWPSSDFTPTCSGTDSIGKRWAENWVDIPELVNYTTTQGTTSGATNKDQNYGSYNTSIMAAITVVGDGGIHAAARYCDKLVVGGYSDWHLPNRYELNLMWVNRAVIPGLDTAISYWSSTEWSYSNAWMQTFSNGNQDTDGKSSGYRIRCVRRY